MFKQLIRTISSLSGNISLSCKLNDVIRIDDYNFKCYVKEATLNPLQMSLFTKKIDISLLYGKWEHDVKRFYEVYNNYFYNSNYTIPENNYKILNEYDKYVPQDSRNKDYEFGCKRIQNQKYDYQYEFYAPFYIDNVCDIPDYFLLTIEINDHCKKYVKVMINEELTKGNYLGFYIDKYVRKLSSKCLTINSDEMSGYVHGISVKKGGFVTIKDSEYMKLFHNQYTINYFDKFICNTFARTYTIMSQIIPIAFQFNINDLLTNVEKNMLLFTKVKISGSYYKNGIECKYYDFSTNYEKYYPLTYDYNENTGKYFVARSTKNVMNCDYPAYNESIIKNHEFTNKLNKTYSRWKIRLSDDSMPYIVNLNYAFTGNNINKYGQWPNTLYGLNPYGIVDNDMNLLLPIGDSRSEYDLHSAINNTYVSNKDNVHSNISKYDILMNNHVSKWFNIAINYDEIKHSIDSTIWSNVDDNLTMFNGIMFNLSNIRSTKFDKFGIFIHPMLLDTMTTDYVKSTYAIVNSDMPSLKNVSKYEDIDYVYYTFDDSEMFKDIIGGMKSSLFRNKVFKQDNLGDFIEVTDFENKCKYVKISDIAYDPWINKRTSSMMKEYLDERKRTLMAKIPIGHNKNLFVQNTSGNYECSFSKYISNNLCDNVIDKLYISYYSSEKFKKLKDVYKLLTEDDISNEKFNLYIQDDFIFINDMFELIEMKCTNPNDIIRYIKNKLIAIDENKIDTYIYEPFGNEDNIYEGKHLEKVLDENVLYIDSYNMNNIIGEYNSNNNTNIKIDNFEISKKYAKFIDARHIKTYLSKLANDYNNVRPIDILSTIYVKKTKLHVRYNNYSDNVSIIDDYERLYDILEQNDIVLLNSNQLINNLSTSRIYNDKFKFSYEGKTLYLDLCFKKEFIKVDQTIIDIIEFHNSRKYNKKYEIYLYKTSADIENKYDTFELTFNDNILSSMTENIDTYLVPLFKNIESNMSLYYTTYLKSVLGNHIVKDLYNDRMIIDNKRVCMVDIDIEEYLIKYSNEETIQMLLDNIYIDNNLKEYISKNSLEYDDVVSDIKLLANIITMTSMNDVKTVLNECGAIKTYSIVEMNELKNMNISTINEDMSYDNELNINYFEKDGKKYAFYFYDLIIDLSNLSFNLNNDTYDTYISFDKINGYDVNNDILARYFYMIYPFLNFNVFNKFLFGNKTILIPKQYTLDLIYKVNKSNILMINTNTNIPKVNLLRYFNDISPLFEKIDSKFEGYGTYYIDKTINTDVEKSLTNLGKIYKELESLWHYEPLKYITTNENSSVIISSVNQFEYKHFNDSCLYILDEHFEINIDELIHTKDLSTYYNEDFIKEKFNEFIRMKRKLDDNKILLFLFNKYDYVVSKEFVSIDTSLNSKKWKIKYIFDII